MNEEQLNYRINEIFRIVTTLLEKSNEHDKKFDNLEGRFDRLEQKFDVLSAQVTESGFGRSKTQVGKH